MERRKRLKELPVHIQDAYAAIQGLRRDCFHVSYIDHVIGYGVFAKTNFEKGQFLLHYKGELLDYREACSRSTEYTEEQNSFLYYFRDSGKKLCYDASCDPFGLNTARMVNDAKDNSPLNNCRMRVIEFRSIPHLCLFSTRSIKQGEELRYDYGVNDLPWRKKDQQDMKLKKSTTTRDKEMLRTLVFSEDETESSGEEYVPDSNSSEDDEDSMKYIEVATHVEQNTSEDDEDSMKEIEVTTHVEQNTCEDDEDSLTTFQTTRVDEQKTSEDEDPLRPFQTTRVVEENTCEDDEDSLTTFQTTRVDEQKTSEDEDPLRPFQTTRVVEENKCEICAKTFKQKCGLATHLKSHFVTSKKGYKRRRRPCPYCNTFQTRLSRHLKLCHSDHEDVKKISMMPAGIQRKHFANLRNIGLLKQNKTKEKMESIKTVTSPNTIVHCEKCKGPYPKHCFARHKQICRKNSDPAEFHGPVPPSLLKETGTDTLPATGSDIRDHQFKEILKSFRESEVGEICRTDRSIKMIGRSQFDKGASKVDKVDEMKKSVMAEMRQLAHLYLEFKSENPKTTKDSSEMFEKDNFSTLRESILNLTTKEDGTIKYGLKNNLYYLLITSSKVLEGNALTLPGESGKEMAQKMCDFRKVLQHHHHQLFGDANYQITKSRQERLRLPERLPKECAMKALRKYSLTRIKVLSELSIEDFSKSSYIELRNLVCSRITLFNARRGGEPARLQMKDWVEKEKWTHKVGQLDNQEAEIFKELEIIYSSGKGTKLVSTLVPKDCSASLDILCNETFRAKADILSPNKFLFPSTLSLKHASGWDATQRIMTKAGIDGKINATIQRSRLSTLYAALDLPQRDRELFYAHMGHNKDVNENTYQRPLPFLAVTRVGSNLFQFDENLEDDPDCSDKPAASTSVERESEAGKGRVERSAGKRRATEENPESGDENLTKERRIKRFCWDGKQESLLRERFSEYINLSSPCKRLPSKYELESFLKSHSCLKDVPYAKARTKLNNDQRLTQTKARRKLRLM